MGAGICCWPRTLPPAATPVPMHAHATPAPSPPPLATCSKGRTFRSRLGLARRKVLARQMRLCVAGEQGDGSALLALLRQPIDPPAVKCE